METRQNFSLIDSTVEFLSSSAEVDVCNTAFFKNKPINAYKFCYNLISGSIGF